MSYSFTVTAANKAEAVAKLAGQMDVVVQSQPVHKADRDAALEAASSYLKLVRDPKEDEHLQVSVHGSMGWARGAVEGEYTGAGVGVSVSIGAGAVKP